MENNEKRAALREIYYELLMLNRTEEQLASLTTIRRAYIESFLMHARNIIDFFEDRKNSEDIRCSDFDVKKKLVNLPPNNSRDEINKFLSHLTKKRIKEKSPDWEITAIKKELHKFFKNLISNLPEDSFPKDYGSRNSFELLLNNADLRNQNYK